MCWRPSLKVWRMCAGGRPKEIHCLVLHQTQEQHVKHEQAFGDLRACKMLLQSIHVSTLTFCVATCIGVHRMVSASPQSIPVESLLQHGLS